MTDITELTAKLKAAEELQLNAREVSNQLRHLADNEIDSDSFAVVTENYNGREVEFERPITDLAIDAACVVDALTEALEAAEELNKHLDLAVRKAEGVSERFRLQAERTELEARTLTVKLPQRAAAGKYVDEEFNNSDLAAIYNACRLECEVKFKNACAAAGIKLQIEGE